MYVDILTRARSDQDFIDEVGRICGRLEYLESKRKDDVTTAHLIQEQISKFCKLCGFNMGLLVPYFFPQFDSDKEGNPKPLSLLDRPFAFPLMDIQVGGYQVIRGSRQIGKSTSFAVRMLIHSAIYPGYRALYIVPHQEHKSTFGNRLRSMERLFRLFQHHTHFRNNLFFKEYPNGAQIELHRVLTNANDVRGKTADELLFDEYQLFDDSLELEVRQCQKASHIPSVIYAGTSTTIDSPLECKYRDSSKATWHVRSPGGGWLNCGDPAVALSMIQPQGPTDPNSGKILDMTQGEWVHEEPHLADQGYVGYHIPQLIIEDFVKEPTKWGELYEYMLRYDESKVLQEILGIPTEEGAREITEQDLINMCDPNWTEADMLKKVKAGEYPHIISGVDWGGSDYLPEHSLKVSYTAHAILGMTRDGSFDILKMRRYSGMNYKDIIRMIGDDHALYQGNSAASDYGGGAVYNLLLREVPSVNPERHLIFNYVGPGMPPLSAPAGASSSVFNKYNLNKTDSISMLFYGIKASPPRIRCFRYEESKEYLSDFLNLMRAPSDTQTGGSTFRYIRHGSRPDDLLHAINFAYVVGRLVSGERVVEDKALKERIDSTFKTSSPGNPLMGFPVDGHVSG